MDNNTHITLPISNKWRQKDRDEEIKARLSDTRSISFGSSAGTGTGIFADSATGGRSSDIKYMPMYNNLFDVRSMNSSVKKTFSSNGYPEKSEKKKDMNNIYSAGILPFYVKNKNIYLVKTLITSNNKLKFLYNNIFFDRYIKSSLIWNLRPLVPKLNLLPNNLLTLYYFGFFKKTTFNNVPILFEGFSNTNFRKYLGTVRYKGLGV